MLFLAATAADAPSDTASRVTATATATVRIVRGAEIRFNSAMRFEDSVARTSVLRERDGSARTASLIEFY